MSNEKLEYINSSQARKLLDITTATLRSWSEKDKIRSIRTVSNHRLYNREDIYNILGRNPTPVSTRRKYIYARVSSKKQMDDLQRQIDFLRTKFPDHIVVTDIASGINWKRKGLKTLLEQSMLGMVEEIVVAHRDRLCRFAWEFMEFVFNQSKTKLVVVDEETGKTGESGEQELAEDLLSIVHIYTCRSMGKRRYKKAGSKVESVSNIPDCGGQEDTDEVEDDE